jgi:hypothetical protein
MPPPRTRNAFINSFVRFFQRTLETLLFVLDSILAGVHRFKIAANAAIDGTRSDQKASKLPEIIDGH